MENKKERDILLPRVSSLRQAKEGDSVSTQEKNLRKNSKRENHEIVGVYTDAGKSASISDDKIEIDFRGGKFIINLDLNKRAGLKRALEEIDKDLWDNVKFTKWDRLSRNSILSKILQIYFKRHEKKLIPIDDSNEPLLIDIKGSLNEEEVKKLAGRVRDVRQMRFEKGMFPARSPFAYRPLIKDKKVIGFKIYPKEAEIVRDVFLMASEGHSYKEICQKHKLKPQQYYNIIKNRVYCGYVNFEGQEKKGIHEAIISEEVFKKVNEKSK